jgi:cell wall-associated protease
MTSSSTPPSTASAGTTVTISGSATGCGVQPSYQFWMLPPGGGWTAVQPYSPSSSFTWSTVGLAPGTYQFSIWARDATSSAAYDVHSLLGYSLTLAPCTAVSVTQNPPSTAPVGTTVTFTATATGCPNGRFEFWVLPPSGTWTVVQGYSGSATLTWTTAGKQAGTYIFSVWARDASSSGSYDAYKSFSYTLT